MLQSEINFSLGIFLRASKSFGRLRMSRARIKFSAAIHKMYSLSFSLSAFIVCDRIKEASSREVALNRPKSGACEKCRVINFVAKSSSWL